MNKKLVAIIAMVIPTGIVPVIADSYYEYYCQHRHGCLRMDTELTYFWDNIDNIIMDIDIGKIPDSSGSYVRIALPVFIVDGGLNVNTYLGG